MGGGGAGAEGERDGGGGEDAKDAGYGVSPWGLVASGCEEPLLVHTPEVAATGPIVTALAQPSDTVSPT